MPRIDPGPSPIQLPDPAAAPARVDLIAAGLQVDPAVMLAGYRRGLFAMPLSGGLIGWFSPDPRGVLPVAAMHVSRSLRRSIRHYRVTFDQDFDAVLAGCADRRRSGHWIDDTFRRCFRALHRLGWAHSVEVWDESGLAGGLFGVESGGLFSGESMFHARTDASKVALAALVTRLTDAGGSRLLDVQWWTPHLGSLGVVEISRRQYLRRLEVALPGVPAFG